MSDCLLSSSHCRLQVAAQGSDLCAHAGNAPCMQQLSTTCQVRNCDYQPWRRLAHGKRLLGQQYLTVLGAYDTPGQDSPCSPSTGRHGTRPHLPAPRQEHRELVLYRPHARQPLSHRGPRRVRRGQAAGISPCTVSHVRRLADGVERAGDEIIPSQAQFFAKD